MTKKLILGSAFIVGVVFIILNLYVIYRNIYPFQ